MSIGETQLSSRHSARSFSALRGAYLTLIVGSTAEAQRIDALLSGGGQIFTEIEETFSLGDAQRQVWTVLDDLP